jgi:hypothetical protein
MASLLRRVLPSVVAVSLAVAVAYAAVVFTFDGAPSSPEPFHPSAWDIQIHDNERTSWKDFPDMAAGHGQNCSAPPATHTITTHEEAVFVCNNHLMTAVHGSLAILILTPNQMVDFSSGEAVVRFDLSTLRTSSRDWVDLWVTPYEENMALPNIETGDLNGPPRRSVQVEMAPSPSTFFRGTVFRNFERIGLPNATYDGLESVMTPSAIDREPFELRISRTHVKFGMPNRNLWWVDTSIDDLGWSKGVIQLGHRAYDASKGCMTFNPSTHQYDVHAGGACPNTWHWDNVSISPSEPFTIIRAAQRYADVWTPGSVTFPTPAPANAHLRFAGVGTSMQISLDGGATWQAAQRQANQPVVGENAFWSYWTPIPAGTTQVRFRGQNTAFDWMARDISIFAPGAGGPLPPTVTPTLTPPPPTTPTQTSTPIAPTSTSTVTPTPTPTAMPQATATATATPTAAACEVRIRTSGGELWLAKPPAFCEL